MALSDYKIKYEIVADAFKAKAEIKSLDGELKRMGGGLATSLGSIAGPAAIAAGSIAGVATAAIGAGTALFAITKQAAQFGAEIFDASQKTGLSAVSLSSMKLAADQSNTSMEQVTKAVSKFSIQIFDAARGSEKAADMLELFGLKPKEALNDLDGALGKVFKKISDTTNANEKAGLAAAAFGKRMGAELIPFIKQFDGDLPGLIKKAKELGVAIDDEAARAADDFGDQLDQLGVQARGVAFTFGRELMPVFTDAMEDISRWVSQNKDEIRDWAEYTGDLVRGLAGIWRDAAGAAREYSLAEATAFGFGQTQIGQIFGALARRGEQERLATQQYGPYSWEMSKPPTITPGGPGSGGRKSGKAADDEFRKFFAQYGFDVTRTFGRAINKGSLHPFGMAADVSVRGKTEDEIARVVAAAIEKGYRLVDERRKVPGVKQTGPHLHFEQAGSAKGSVFQPGMYGGVPLGYLQELDAARLGKIAGGEAAYNEWLKKKSELSQKQRDEELDDEERQFQAIIAEERQAMQERLDIRRTEADLAEEILEGQLQRGELTEREYAQRMSELRIGVLEDERDELSKQIPSREIMLRLNQIDLEIEREKLKGKREELDIEKRISEEYEKQIRALQKKNQRPYQMKTRTGPGEGDGFLDELYNATGRIQTMDDVMRQLGQTATDVFMQMGQGLGAMLESWVLLGDQANVSMKKMVAAVLAGVAAQAATLAIFHLAMGIAALTPWGAAMYGPAPLHFKAAAIWGAIAVGAALAGRAVAGDSNKSGGGRSSETGSASAGGRQNADELLPYSRTSPDAFISGRRDPHTAALARAVEKLEAKLDAMRPGDVLTAGMRQRPGAVGTQVAADVGRNAGIGRAILQKAGVK